LVDIGGHNFESCNTIEDIVEACILIGERGLLLLKELLVLERAEESRARVSMVGI